MKLPKIGETVLAFQLRDSRIGETQFLCATQSNATRSRKVLEKEIRSTIIMNTGELIRPTPEQIASDRKEIEQEIKRVVVWEMKRIK